MYTSPISDEGKTGISLAQSRFDDSRAKCIMFDNDVLCAEEGEEGNTTGMGVPQLSGTIKFEIIGLEA
jgi:hypothetical protein